KQIISNFGSILNKVFVHYYIQYGKGSHTAKMYSTKCTSEHSLFWLYGFMDQGGGHSIAVCDPFGNSYQIGSNIGMLMGKEFPRPAIAGLNFVKDKQRSCLLTSIFHFCEEIIVWYIYTANTLNPLYNYSTV